MEELKKQRELRATRSAAEAANFNFNGYNRSVNQAHVRELKKSILMNGMLVAVTVNTRTNNVLDGQHRISAIRELLNDGMISEGYPVPVDFVDVPASDETRVIIETNGNHKARTTEDEIEYRIKLGDRNYTTLADWCAKHPLVQTVIKSKANENPTVKLDYRYGAAILTGKNCCTSLKKGVFTATQEDALAADAVCREIELIVDRLGLRDSKGPWLEALAISWHANRRTLDIDSVIKVLKSKKAVFSTMSKNGVKDFNAIFDRVAGYLRKSNAA